MLSQRSDWRGAWAVASTWAVIAASFAVLAYAATLPLWAAAPLFVLGMILLGGRQLALAVLMHDGGHGTLFKSRWANDVLTDWLCARPIWNDLPKYRAHHRAHHTRTSSAEDPDLSLVAPFPITRGSLARKFLRDVSGLTGLKYYFGRLLMDAGYIQWTVSADIRWLPQKRSAAERLSLLLRNVTPTLITNGLLFVILWACGQAWLYALWVLAYATPFPLFLRIRSMAEHACRETGADALRNTRTTRAGWLARVMVAPLRVNYHIEHHLMASVPFFRLPLMHRMLRERGAVEPAPGYAEVLRTVTTAA